MQSEQVDKLATALAKAQGEMENAKINKINPHFKNRYADLTAIVDMAREPLAKNGLAVTQLMEMRGDSAFILVTRLLHASGQWLQSEYPLPVNTKPQELGSALTYGRRYSMSAILGKSADEDDDAEVARETGQTATAKAKPSAVKPQTVSAPHDKDGKRLPPHEVAVPKKQDGSGDDDWLVWGQLYLAAVRESATVQEIGDWNKANEKHMSVMDKAAPRAFQVLTERVMAIHDHVAAKE